MTYDTKAMTYVYRNYFQVDRKSILTGRVRPTGKLLIFLIPMTKKRKAYFYLQ